MAKIKTLKQYNTKYKKVKPELLQFTKSELEIEAKSRGCDVEYLLKGRKWIKIKDTYCEIPRVLGGRWFRSLKAGVQVGICTITGGAVVASGAVPTVITINNIKAAKQDEYEKLNPKYNIEDSSFKDFDEEERKIAKNNIIVKETANAGGTFTYNIKFVEEASDLFKVVDVLSAKRGTTTFKTPGDYTVKQKGDGSLDVIINTESLNKAKGEISFTPKLERKEPLFRNLEVKTAASTTTFKVGEKFTAAGLVLNAVYSDGSKEEVTLSGTRKFSTSINEGYKFTQADVSESKTVTVTYKEKIFTRSITYDIRVDNATLEGLIIKTASTKLSFKLGETFSCPGLTLEATYSDKTTKIISYPNFSTNQDNVVYSRELYTPGQEVTVIATYTDGEISKEVNYLITIEDATLENITFDSTSTVIKEFKQGQYFSTTGLKVTAVFSDGYSITVKDGDTGLSTDFDKFKTTKFTEDDVGDEKTVTVSYKYGNISKTCSYNIDVKYKTIEKIEIETEAAKKIFDVGDNFDPTGLSVRATYSDESYDIIEYGDSRLIVTDPKGGAKFTDEDVDKEFNVSVKVSTAHYGEKDTSYKISVSKGYVTSIEIDTEPATKKYEVGENFSIDGMIVTATYSSGKTATIEGEGLSVLTTNFDEFKSEKKFTNDNIGLGQTVTVSLDPGGSHPVATDTYSIDILHSKVTSIEITKQPTTKSFKVGESFNSDGLEITAHFAASEPEVIPENQLTITHDGGDPFTATDIGDNKNCHITYTLDGETVSTDYTFAVTAATLEAIELDTSGAKLEFVAGQTFSSDGLKVTPVFSDLTKGDTVTCPDDHVSTNFDGQTLTEGTGIEVTVTYNDGLKTVTNKYQINVVAKTVTNLTINSLKDSYHSGEYFTLSDTDSITVNYNDSSYETFTGAEELNNNFTFSETGNRLYKASSPITLTITHKTSTKTATKKLTIGDPIVNSLSIKSPTKTNYERGTYFDITGMEVKGVKTDDTTTDPLSSTEYTMTLNGKTLTNGTRIMETIGVTYPVTVNAVSYSVSNTFNLTVKDPLLTKLEILTKPTTLDYRVASEDTYLPKIFSNSGLKVKTTYSDDSTNENYTKYKMYIKIDDEDVEITNGLTFENYYVPSGNSDAVTVTVKSTENTSLSDTFTINICEEMTEKNLYYEQYDTESIVSVGLAYGASASDISSHIALPGSHYVKTPWGYDTIRVGEIGKTDTPNLCNLTNIKSLSIPATDYVFKFYSDSISGCTNLKTIIYRGSSTDITGSIKRVTGLSGWRNGVPCTQVYCVGDGKYLDISVIDE